MHVCALNIFPIKGVRAVPLTEMVLAPRGPIDDRRWLIVDETGKFLTQRTCPQLATMSAGVAQNGVTIEADGQVLAVNQGAARRVIRIWDDNVDALDAGDEAAHWLSAKLGQSVRLVFMDERASRETSGRWGAKAPVSFADGYPILVTNKASLAVLNNAIEAHGGTSIGMDRFRANIVIEGAEPWQEDHWETLQIGEARLHLEKPCVRCQVPTLDQQTGESTGKEPLATLARIRRIAHSDINGVIFGINGTTNETATIKLDDPVSIISNRDVPWQVI